jgi:hypothetical protein
MLSKLFLILLLVFSPGSKVATRPVNHRLTDQTMRHILNTLPKMVPQLQKAGITVSQAYYIWPRDAALDAKGEKILENYGYDALQLNALEIFCKAWFCINYDSLIQQRQKIIMTTEEQTTENPYITDEQKRINIHILNKDLGHSREELEQSVGKDNLRQVQVYKIKIQEIWKKIQEDIE